MFLTPSVRAEVLALHGAPASRPCNTRTSTRTPFLIGLCLIRIFFFLRQLQASVRAEALALHGAPLRAHATLALLHVHRHIGLLGYPWYILLADPRPTAAAPPHRSRSLALLLVASFRPQLRKVGKKGRAALAATPATQHHCAYAP